MPWLFAFSLVAFLLAVIVFIAWRGEVSLRRKGEDTDNPAEFLGLAIVAGLGGIVLLAFSSTTIVSTRNVGIVTSFGRPVGTMNNGLHLKWPWLHVPELNGTIRTDSQTGGFQDGKCSNGTPVRLANNSTACVDNTIRWRIHQDAGDALYRDYMNDANIRDSLVTRKLNATLNAVFANYNPLTPESGTNGPKLGDLSDRVTNELRTQIGGQIDVQDVIISIVHFDATTQDRINAYQAQIALTRIAEESKNTAAAQAEANQKLAASNDPNILVARCLEANAKLPAPIPCIPGAGMPFPIPGGR